MAYEIGVQSFTYRNFSVKEICRELEGTDITAIEFCGVHIEPGAGEREVENLRELTREAGLRICGYGVHNFDADYSPQGIRGTLEFAKGLGATYVSVDFPPDATRMVWELIAVAKELDLRLAIHNHGPEATYSQVEDILRLLERYPPPLGACVDTGHFLRSGEAPDEVIPRLGNRVYAVHLKDFFDEETEVIPGQGELDLTEFLALLDEHTQLEEPIVIEYEEDPEDPTPAVMETARNLRG